MIKSLLLLFFRKEDLSFAANPHFMRATLVYA